MDTATPGGATWRQTISRELKAAECVIVVWSDASVSEVGEFVQDEAARARQRGVLLPVRIDEVSPPLGFGEIQSLDLIDWRGRLKDARFDDVLRAAKAMIDGEPRPRPKAPGKRRRVAAAVTAVGAPLLLILGTAADIAGLQEPVCQIPGVRAVCRQAGLGGVPSKAEEALWESRTPGDCELLGAYLESFPSGAHAEEARSRLQAAELISVEAWKPEERRLPMTVRQTLDPLADEGTARSDAQARS